MVQLEPYFSNSFLQILSPNKSGLFNKISIFFLLSLITFSFTSLLKTLIKVKRFALEALLILLINIIITIIKIIIIEKIIPIVICKLELLGFFL